VQTSPPTDAVTAGKAYRSSWVDASQRAIERLPWAPWLTYLAAYLVLAAAETGLKWTSGTYPAGTVVPFHLVVAGSGVYAYALLHHLDHVASRALDAFKPALNASTEVEDAARRMLTTMPFGPTTVAAVVGLSVGLAQRFGVATPNLAGIGFATSGPGFVLEFAFLVLQWTGLGVVVYHVFRQFRTIDTLYREHAIVRLYDPRPLYAFSQLSSRTALGMALVAYAWIATYPRASAGASAQVFVAMMATLVVLAAITFVWPLWGAHQRLVAEKQQRMASAHARYDAVSKRLAERIETGDPAAIESAHRAAATLTAEVALLEKASTWPWPTSTLRGFLTAVLLPLVVWTAQTVLGRWLASP
jgi:hypothetical protein